MLRKYHRRGMPDDVPRTWILTLRDHTFRRSHNVRHRRDRRSADHHPDRHLPRSDDQRTGTAGRDPRRTLPVVRTMTLPASGPRPRWCACRPTAGISLSTKSAGTHRISRCWPWIYRGRRDKPGDLRTDTIADWVESVVRDIEDAGFDDVVIVGPFVGGRDGPGVVTKLGAPRVREMIFATAFVPPEGTAVVDTLLARFRGTRAEAPRQARSAKYLLS